METGGPEFSNQAAHTNEINARFNWWGDEATAQMNEGKNPKNIDEIYDEYDDASKGFVNYSDGSMIKMEKLQIIRDILVRSTY